MQKRYLPPESAPVAHWRGLFLALMAFTSLLSVCFPLRAEVWIAVVTHPGDSWQANAGKRLLANIYRRKLTINDLAVPYVPVNLPAADPLRRAFTRSLFGQSPEDMQGYWNQQYFHGISPPHVLASTEAILRFVQSTPGALGYVLDCEVDERVTVLFKLPLMDPPLALMSRCSGL